MNNAIMAGFYARVSSDQQSKKGTIESQITALKEKMKADEVKVTEELQFIDDGFSGANLVRPELERLRDQVSLGLVDRLYIHSPDRLSRKYAYQVLLLDEIEQAGVEVVFLNHELGKTPEDELLLQVQGMIAEYERAKITERHRRGKLHQAKNGNINVLSGAPYGYQYIKREHNGLNASYVVNLPEAAVVKKVFNWIGIERISIGQVVKNLDAAGIKTKTGKSHWDRSVIWSMLQNPAYMGKAAFGKTKAGDLRAKIRPQKHSAEVPKKAHSVYRVKPDEWIEIPVPALVSEEVFNAVQVQLEENRKHARQRKRGASYLLQGLIVCGHCQYAYYGKPVSRSSAKGKKQYAYYRCIGTDAYRFGGERVCDNKQVRTETLDEIVWEQVVDLLNNPKRLEKEYHRRLSALEKEDREQYDTSALKTQKKRLEQGKSRLIDSYAEGLIDKPDFEPKIRRIKNKLLQIEQQITKSNEVQFMQYELFLVINRLEEFSKSVNDKIETVDFLTKREIIRSLVKRVEVYKNEVVVVFRVSPNPEKSTQSRQNSPKNREKTKSLQDCSRRANSPLGRTRFSVIKQTFINISRCQPFIEDGFIHRYVII